MFTFYKITGGLSSSRFEHIAAFGNLTNQQANNYYDYNQVISKWFTLNFYY